MSQKARFLLCMFALESRPFSSVLYFRLFFAISTQLVALAYCLYSSYHNMSTIILSGDISAASRPLRTSFCQALARMSHLTEAPPALNYTDEELEKLKESVAKKVVKVNSMKSVVIFSIVFWDP